MDNIIIFDTEFICNPKEIYPIELFFKAYDLKGAKFTNNSLFNVFIKPNSKNQLNKFFIRYTGISKDFLDHNGISYNKAKKLTIDYIKKFDLNKTVFIGWDIVNDSKLFKKFLRSLRLNIRKLKFIDLSNIYKKYKKEKILTALKKACEEYNLSSSKWHDAKSDATMTYKLLIKMIKQYKLDNIINEDNIKTIK